MVFAVESNIKVDMNGFKSLLNNLKEASKTVAVSGVSSDSRDVEDGIKEFTLADLMLDNLLMFLLVP